MSFVDHKTMIDTVEAVSNGLSWIADVAYQLSLSSLKVLGSVLVQSEQMSGQFYTATTCYENELIQLTSACANVSTQLNPNQWICTTVFDLSHTYTGSTHPILDLIQTQSPLNPCAAPNLAQNDILDMVTSNSGAYVIVGGLALTLIGSLIYAYTQFDSGDPDMGPQTKQGESKTAISPALQLSKSNHARGQASTKEVDDRKPNNVGRSEVV